VKWNEYDIEEEEDEEELETGIEKEVRERTTGNAGRVLPDPEILAAEILSNKKYLAVFLKLAKRPKTAKELVNSYIMVKRKVKSEYGSYYEEKWVATKFPRSTMYRVLKRLKELGLIEVYKALDYRKKYYRLTDLGKQVLEKVIKTIKESLKSELEPAKNIRYMPEEYEGYRGLGEYSFKELIYKKLGLPLNDIIAALNVEKVKVRSDTYYLIKYEKEERRSTWY